MTTEVCLASPKYKSKVENLEHCRCVGLSGWLHEHCSGADRGVLQWTAEEQVWRCFHQGEQCAVHLHSEEEIDGEEVGETWDLEMF